MDNIEFFDLRSTQALEHITHVRIYLTQTTNKSKKPSLLKFLKKFFATHPSVCLTTSRSHVFFLFACCHAVSSNDNNCQISQPASVENYSRRFKSIRYYLVLSLLLMCMEQNIGEGYVTTKRKQCQGLFRQSSRLVKKKVRIFGYSRCEPVAIQCASFFADKTNADAL